MNTSGRAREGWMALIPLFFFIFFVVAAVGGPRQFISEANYWLHDLLTAVVRWAESF